MSPSKFSWKKRLKSFVYAWKGIQIVFQTQHNTWLHLTATLIVLTAGMYFHISPAQWACLVIVIGIVWITEFINTALEKLVNLVSPQHHPLAGKVKDIAAGAVLVSAVIALVVGMLVFIPIWIG